MLFLNAYFSPYSWVLFSWKPENIFPSLYDLSYRNNRADFVVAIELFWIQGKTLVRQDLSIQNEMLYKINGLFAEAIFKSSSANLVS